MKVKVKRLHPNEKFACTIRAVKTIFGNENNENVYVSFGFLGRDFSFDSADRKRPKLQGTVIASGSINRRDIVSLQPSFEERTKYFSFYAIRDTSYGAKSEKTFVEVYLPLLYRWYQEVSTNLASEPSGIEVFLIEWYDGGFKTHSYRYH